MTQPTTLLRAVLLATAIAAPSVTLAEQGDMAKAAIQNMREPAARSLSTPLLTPIDPLPAKVHGDGSETVRKGAWILDTSLAGQAAAPASKPKEIVVVGSKLDAPVENRLLGVPGNPTWEGSRVSTYALQSAWPKGGTEGRLASPQKLPTVPATPVAGPRR
jgi:hypothetical protein